MHKKVGLLLVFLAALSGCSSLRLSPTVSTISVPNSPSFSIGTGTFSAPLTVTIREASACATVYYTTDGSTPTAASAVYSSPISISKTTRLQAIAECPESGSSAVSSATYTFSLSALNPPSFSIGTGTFSAPFTVTISEASTCATVYYTTDGSTPTADSAVYSSSISISKTTRLQAIAECPESGSSAVSSATYTFSLSALNPPSFSIGTGTFSAPFTVTISEASTCAAVYYTTDGSTPTTASAVYSSPISISKTTTLQAIAECPESGSSAVSSATYTFSLSVPNPPSFSIGTGTFSAPFTVTISEASTCATVYYTTDGSTPTTASAVYSSPISISTTTMLKAIAECSGGSSSSVSSATYTMSSVATPVLSLPTGTYESSIQVTIGDPTSGATVYYTTNGATPTTSSPIYNGPLTFSNSSSPSATITLKAIAALPGASVSSPAAASYTILPASTPQTSASSFFGMDVNGLTYGTPWPVVPVGVLRLWDSNTPWSGLNPSSGTYTWTFLDENIKLAQENNAQIIYTFGRTPSWAVANGAGCTGSYAPNGCEEAPVLADWDAYVTAIINHVGPGVIKYWELWNEANLTGEYWSGTDAQLVQMAADAREIIKAVDPNAVILSPSETDNYTGSTACTSSNRCGSAWLQGWLQAGGAAYIDGVAFHAYPQINETPEQVVSQVANQRAVMSANGVGSLPLLDTESSWGKISDLPATADQVAFLARHLLLEQSSGVTTSVWYAYDGGDWGPLWSKSSGLNEAGEAYGQVAEWLTGAALATPCAASGTTYTCAYTRANGYTALAVWNTGGDATFSVPAGYIQYRDLAGDLIAISGATVPISEAPILLESASAF